MIDTNSPASTLPATHPGKPQDLTANLMMAMLKTVTRPPTSRTSSSGGGGGCSNWSNQTVWTADNLHVMRGMNSESVDLLYLDPPFNSKTDYAAPVGSAAAGAAFKDTWTLHDVDVEWINLIQDKHPRLHRVLLAAMTNSDKAYLAYMAVRLLEMHRLLKPTGSLYLHCDPTMSHYLKLMLDAIFGRKQFRNEVVWHYGKMSNSSRNFPCNHDTILRYSKSDEFVFNSIRGANSEYKARFQRYLTVNKVLYGTVKGSGDKLILGRRKKVEKELGRPLNDSDVLFDFDKEFKVQSDVIYTPIIKGNSAERVGYPTQKPLKLLQKIISASSNPGDIVFDPFCGCATTLVAAHDLGHQWAGIDISEKAAELVTRRITERQGLFTGLVHRTDIPQRNDLGCLPAYNSAANRKTLYGEQGGDCAGCGTHFEMRHLEVDHIIARSKGGTDHMTNLQLLCGNCNRVKGDRGMDYLKTKLQLAA